MSLAGGDGPGPEDGPGDARRSTKPRERPIGKVRAPRAVQAPYFPADEETERHRTRIVSSSPLKRIEDEERELQRRQETARFGLRLTIMGLIVLVAFSAVVVRLWSLQVLHSSQYRNEASVYETQTVPITPARGLILSREGKVLVGDEVLPVVTLSRSLATPVVAGRLAALLGESVAEVNTALNNPQASPYQPVPIAIGVSQATIVYLSEHENLFPGVSVAFTAERTYPYGDTAAQVIGYTGDIDESELKSLAKYGYTADDVIGQAGLESTYELYLRGKPGSEVIKVDAVGNPVGTASTTPPVSGDDLVLNMDVGLEQEVTKALTDQINRLAGKQPARRRRGGGRARPPDRRRARHGVRADLQPAVVGGGHLRPALPAAHEPGRPRSLVEPGHPGPVGARLHLQARHRDHRLERRDARQHGGLHQRPGLLPHRGALCRPVHLLRQRRGSGAG